MPADQMFLSMGSCFPFRLAMMEICVGYVGTFPASHRLVIGGWSPGKDFCVSDSSNSAFMYFKAFIVVFGLMVTLPLFESFSAPPKDTIERASPIYWCDSWRGHPQRIYPTLFWMALAPCADRHRDRCQGRGENPTATKGLQRHARVRANESRTLIFLGLVVVRGLVRQSIFWRVFLFTSW